MVKDDNASPLPADPSRQAHRTIAAYGYQLWQSVLAWVSLEEGESLYLEGAEDIDVITNAAATAIQVKDSARRITLRSQDVQEALANAWKLLSQSRVPMTHYRYLTRGEAGVEAGNPFGKGVCGLHLWHAAASDMRRVRPLARFLLKLHRLPVDLREFLRKNSDEQIAATLFSHVHWDTENLATEFVEDAVKLRLILLGECQRVPATESSEARHRLFNFVMRVARDPARRVLTRAELLQEFDSATRVSMPCSEAAELRELARSFQVGMPIDLSTGTTPLRFGERVSSALAIPHLSIEVYRSRELVGCLRDVLTKCGALILIGSSGMGKTTLAKLVLKENDVSWLWLSFSGTTSTDAQRLIIECLRRLLDSPTKINVVLDDVDFSPAFAREWEQALGGLVQQLRARKGSLIITAQKTPSRRLLDAGAIPQEAVVVVPALSRGEISSLIELLGGPIRPLSETWATACELFTRGHPQLAQAFLFALRARGWPKATGETLSTPLDAIASEKAQVRQLLESVPEAHRELLYRLTIVSGPFRRDHALALGGTTPPLARPGEHFDRLVGPWVEAVGSQYYRVSPLLEKAGEAVYGPKQLQSLRIAVVDSMAVCEPRTFLEAGVAFRQAWIARSKTHLGSLFASFVNAPRKIFEAIARQIEWFTNEGLQTKCVLFPENRSLSRMLRCLQIRVAQVTFPSRLSQILSAWHGETHNSVEEAHPIEKCMLALNAVTCVDLPLPARQIFAYLRDIEVAESSLPDIAEGLAETRRRLPTRLLAGAEDTTGLLTQFVTIRCRSSAQLKDIFSAIDEESAPFRARILRMWRSRPFHLRALIDRIWLENLKTNQPDWQECLAVLEQGFCFGEKWGIMELSIAAIRATTVVLDEHMHQPDKALDLLEERAARQKIESALLDDARAMVHFNHKRYESSLTLWKSALKNWPASERTEDRSMSFAARTAGISAGRLDRWDEAAELFLEAYNQLAARGYPEYRAGILADASFALWRAGRPVDAAQYLAAATRLAELLPEGKDNLLAFRARKLISSVVIWVQNNEIGHSVEMFTEPQLGMCSELEAHEGFRSLPDNDFDVTLLCLARLQVHLGISAKLGDGLAARLENAALLSVRYFYQEYQVASSLRRLELTDLPELALRFTLAVEESWRKDSTLACPWEDVDDSLSLGSLRALDPVAGAGLFAAALIVAASAEHDLAKYITTWCVTAAGMPGGDRLVSWLEDTGSRLKADEEVSAAVINDNTVKWFKSVIAALRLCMLSGVGLQNLALAQFRILDTLSSSQWLVTIGPELSELFARGWRRALLSTPALSLSAVAQWSIRAAYEDQQRGLPKAAKIFLAAADAVGFRIGKQLRLRLEAMRSGDFRRLLRS